MTIGRTVEAMDETANAKLAALTILQGRTCANFLRARGRHEHAEGMESALAETMRLMAQEFGAETFSAAIDWASDQFLGIEDGMGLSKSRH